MSQTSSITVLVLVSLCSLGNTFAQTVDQHRELIFPIVSAGPAGNGTHFQTTFSFTNFSDSTIDGSLHIFDGEGNNVTDSIFGVCREISIPGLPPVEEKVVEVEAAETVRFVMPLVDLLDGWASLSWFGPPGIVASAELTLIDGPFGKCAQVPVEERLGAEIVTSTVFMATGWQTKVQFPVVRSRYRETAFSLVESFQPIITGAPFFPILDVQILDAAGNVVREFSRFQGDHERQGRLLSEILSLSTSDDDLEPLPEEFRGWVRLMSGWRVAVQPVDVLFPELGFVNVPIIEGELP